MIIKLDGNEYRRDKGGVWGVAVGNDTDDDYEVGPAMDAALDEIERLQTLFGGRFHLDSTCGSCGGPLEVERDAICCRCTDAELLDEIKRLRAILDRIEAIQGCECDSYEGHRCLMCRVREIAREARAE
jgi:hypothetical protein